MWVFPYRAPIFEKACLSFGQFWTIFIYFQCFWYDRTTLRYILVTSSDFFTDHTDSFSSYLKWIYISRYDNGDRITKAEVWNLWTVTLELKKLRSFEMEKLCQSRSSWTFFALIHGLVLISICYRNYSKSLKLLRYFSHQTEEDQWSDIWLWAERRTLKNLSTFAWLDEIMLKINKK